LGVLRAVEFVSKCGDPGLDTNSCILAPDRIGGPTRVALNEHEYLGMDADVDGRRFWRPEGAGAAVTMVSIYAAPACAEPYLRATIR
jgi:hypothetical protein